MTNIKVMKPKLYSDNPKGWTTTHALKRKGTTGEG